MNADDSSHKRNLSQGPDRDLGIYMILCYYLRLAVLSQWERKSQLEQTTNHGLIDYGKISYIKTGRIYGCT